MPAGRHRPALDEIVAGGMAAAPLDHARQVVAVAGILYEAFQEAGLAVVLVGGSAIEVHAPGVYKSADIDFVIKGPPEAAAWERVGSVFEGLGFARQARHWVRGDLFVEVPGFGLDDPHELYRGGTGAFEVVTKEAVLFRRVVGFKYWQYTGYGQQAINMLSAFGGTLDRRWLREALEAEGAFDAFTVLERLAGSGRPVTEAVLNDILRKLHARRG